MRSRKYIIASILFLFCFIHANAQYEDEVSEPVTEKKFYTELRRLNIKYSPPRGYKLSYVPQLAQIGRILLTESRHQLKAPKDSVFVYFAENSIDTSKTQADKLKKFGLYNDPNLNYLKIYSDTLKYPIAYHSRDLSKKKYGADRSGTYDLPLPQPYKGQYRFCKTLFIHKENRADLLLYFFYNPGSAKKLDMHIAKMSKSIKFLD